MFLGFYFLLLTGNWEKNIVLLVCLAEAPLAEAETENTPENSHGAVYSLLIAKVDFPYISCNGLKTITVFWKTSPKIILGLINETSAWDQT